MQAGGGIKLIFGEDTVGVMESITLIMREVVNDILKRKKQRFNMYVDGMRAVFKRKIMSMHRKGMGRWVKGGCLWEGITLVWEGDSQRVKRAYSARQSREGAMGARWF